MRAVTTIAATLVCVFAFAPQSMAQQTAPAPEFSAHPEVRHIADELEETWRQNPEAFRQVDAIREHLRQHAGRTARPVDAVSMLNNGGQDLLLPMLWAVASDNPLKLRMDLRSWRSWRTALLEAIGRLRDERSIAVLKPVVAGNQPHAAIRKTAASAIGRTGDLDAIEWLIDHAKSHPPHRKAVVGALGDARRHSALDYLLKIVKDTDETRALRSVAIRSAGDWANQWAWETSSLKPYRAEGERGRRAVIETLVDGYPSLDDDLRSEAAKSLQLAGATEARRRAQTRAKNAERHRYRTDWRELAERLEDSPLAR